MKKKIYGVAIGVSIAAIAVFNLNITAENSSMAVLTMNNIEALADDETNPEKTCHSEITKAPDDNSLALRVIDCSDCKEYWASKASSPSTCP